MILNLITLATVKTQLGLAVTTYDSALTAMIPIVSSDVRRILNTNYNIDITATYVENEDSLTVIYGIEFPMGQVIYGEDIPNDTYITGYHATTGIYTLSANATGDGSFVYPTLSISQWPSVSKMVWYRTTQNNTTTVSTELLKSQRIGPLSKTYSDSEINKQWDYPQTLLNDLGVPYAEVG